MRVKVSAAIFSTLLLGLSAFTALIPSQRLSAQESNRPLRTAWTSDLMMRSMAVKSVRPIYPESALRHGKSGVVVADVHASPEGTVTAVDILETPGPAIGASVRRALAQWKFKFGDPAKDEGRVELSAKLVFYFEIQHGKGLVLYPSEAGYVGHWPTSSEGSVGISGATW